MNAPGISPATPPAKRTPHARAMLLTWLILAGLIGGLAFGEVLFRALDEAA